MLLWIEQFFHRIFLRYSNATCISIGDKVHMNNVDIHVKAPFTHESCFDVKDSKQFIHSWRDCCSQETPNDVIRGNKNQRRENGSVWFFGDCTRMNTTWIMYNHHEREYINWMKADWEATESRGPTDWNAAMSSVVCCSGVSLLQQQQRRVNSRHVEFRGCRWLCDPTKEEMQQMKKKEGKCSNRLICSLGQDV